MSKQKPSLYDQFREKVLADLNRGDPSVCREKYVNWSEVVSTVTTVATNPFSGRKLHYTKRHKVWFDRKWRDKQLNILHRVMEDLVKEGILSRGRRDKPNVYHCDRYIRWNSRLKDPYEPK